MVRTWRCALEFGGVLKEGLKDKCSDLFKEKASIRIKINFVK
jgi:hypothetical protein